MSIEVGCTNCGTRFRARDEFAGRQGNCPKCRAAIVVPAAAESVPPTRKPEAVKQKPPSVDDLLPPEAKPMESRPQFKPAMPLPPPVPSAMSRQAPARSQPVAQPSAPLATPQPVAMHALVGHIERVKSPWGYKASVLLVAVVMILLPMIYVALIGAVGYGMVWHAMHDTGILSEMKGSGRGSIFLLLIYVAPLVAGGILVLFMIKPLFAKPVKRDNPRSLTRQGEPKLFVFVDQLCDVVGAPKPRRIDVDCQVNASAGLRRGWLSMFGNDLVLTIGLPLVAGLSMQQFSGVLAHEFGHFTQGWGMRLSYIIRSISFWFTRVVYQRDEWDQKLVEASRAWDYRIGFILYFARFSIFLTRKVLWVLMIVGHAVAGILLRQMEFDADLHETRLAGSGNFETTCRRLAVLNVATQGAFADLQHWYKESRLGDNFPKLLMANVEQLPAEVVAKIQKAIDESKTGWLDTHPSDHERIERARAEQAVGLFHSDRPATELFSDFNAISKTSTFDFFKAMLGKQLKLTDLHPTEALLEKQQREGNTHKAMTRYFQGMFRTLRPLPMPKRWAETPADVKATLKALTAAREQMLAALPDYKLAFAEFDTLDTRTIQALEDVAIVESGLKPPERPMFARPKTREDAKRIVEQCEYRIGQLRPRLRRFEDVAAARLIAALELLQAPQVAAKLKANSAQLQRANDFLSCTMVMADSINELIDLRNHNAALCTLLNNLKGHEQNQKFVQAVLHWADMLQQRVRKMHQFMGNFTYPFEHGRGEITIAKYCLEILPAKDDLGGNLNAASAYLDRLPTLFLRLMAQITMMAEKVEYVLGLPLLAEPAADGARAATELKAE